MTLTPTFWRVALVAGAAAAVLAACGGGNGSDSTATTATAGPTASALTYTLQTYITDNLATEYSKVWVTIQKITATDGSGASVTLFDAGASPVTVNLSSLANVGQFLATVTLPAGVYAQVQVTLGNSVQLVSLDGTTTTNAKFSATGTSFVWTIRDLDLNPANTGQLVLDFNLAKFSYDASTGIVTPVVERRDAGEAFGKFTGQVCEVHGTVTALNVAAGTFTVNDARLGTVVVTLAADASIVNEATQAKVALADLLLGANVEVKGTVTPGATTADPSTVTTSLVHVLPVGSTGTGTTAVPRLAGAGSVTAVNGALVTVALNDANFLPSSNSVVVDTSSARFAHGTASDLAVGVQVRFSGKASAAGSTTVVATVFDIDGAASTTRPGDRFAPGVSGKVGSVASSTAFTLVVTTGTTAVPAGTYSVNASGATYPSGTSSCLVAGASVRVVGTVSGTTLTATRVSVEGCAGQEHSAPARR